jgi:hypothetical protein
MSQTQQPNAQHEHILALVRKFVPPVSAALHKGQAGE